jgi:hypothetical protein
MRVIVASGLALAAALAVPMPAAGDGDGAGAAPLEQLVRERLQAGETAIGLGALALSLLLALRRERIPGPAAAPDQPRSPESSREVDLFQQRYVVSFARGTLEPSGRSGRRLMLRPQAGGPVFWQPPDPAFSVPIGGAAGARPLAALTAGGRAIASLDPVTNRVAFHEADLARLHGIGRRGRGLLLWPLLLATTAVAALADRALNAFLAQNAGLSPSQLRLSVLVTASAFALGEAVLLGTALAIVSAVLRRVRGAQFHRQRQSDLRAFLEDRARSTDG